MDALKYNPGKQIKGTFGEMWIDDYYAAETTGLEAKVTLEKSEVKQTGTLAKGYKVTGITCKGTVKLNKVSSFFIKKMSEDLKAGKSTQCTIISKVADPESDGIERVRLTGCTFDEMTLANWEAGKLGEESYPFTFTSWEVLDTIDTF